MTRILAYMPTYSPYAEATFINPRPYTRQSNIQIDKRFHSLGNGCREKPWVYMDAIDSVLNTRPDMHLVVADARSTDSIRDELIKHHQAAEGRYSLSLYTDRMSQWKVFNNLWKNHAAEDTEYFVYTSSDIFWGPDWVAEAIKEFEKDPALQIIFPCVQSGDPNLPAQIAPGPRDLDLIEAPYQHAARAPVINAYAMIFRNSFLKAYGGYPDIFRNCFSESFLFYMCEAMGGKLRLMPRGWCFHLNAVDAWKDSGGLYNYDAEFDKFQSLMTHVQKTRMEGEMTIEFLKRTLSI